jgi:hypothetical protein
MSAQSVEIILIRAMSDAAFADMLFTDIEHALSGYELTDEERSRFEGMTRAEFDKYTATPPDERRSMWGTAAQSGV